jgi:Sulfotransferase family
MTGKLNMVQRGTTQPQSVTSQGPLVIGGTGGSGTRVVAHVVHAAGWFMGAQVAPNTLDAVPLARFDWTYGHDIISGRAPSSSVVAAFREALAGHLSGHDPQRPWGWKHPHSYLLLPFLAQHCPGLRFVHVIRDGRDVALSDNQNQANHYGDIALGQAAPSPARSLRFWAWANTRCADDGIRLLGERYLLVRMEDLFAGPESEVPRLLRFAGYTGPELDSVIERLMTRPPPTIGRWRTSALADAAGRDSTAGDALKRFGYTES